MRSVVEIKRAFRHLALAYIGNDTGSSEKVIHLVGNGTCLAPHSQVIGCIMGDFHGGNGPHIPARRGPASN